MSLEKPNWSCKEDREMYWDIACKSWNGEHINENEKDFVKRMYHIEEVVNTSDSRLE